ncbi:hypothetical protein HY251_08845 [bacterium]|nr:hypothetical protein [bacterium]
MWELRIFGEPDRVLVPDAVLAVPRDEEVRTDAYVLLESGEEAPAPRFDAAVGLKVRSGSVDKCELKQRFDRDPSGAELWEKVFDRRLPLEPEWLLALLGHLGARTEEPLSPAHTAADLARACELAGLGKSRIVRVRKRIVRAPRPPALYVEHAEIAIDPGGKDARPLRSLAVEAPTLDACLTVAREAGLSSASEAPTGVLVSGYPEALGLFLSRGKGS